MIHYIRKHLNDALVVFLAGTWLALAFIPMLASDNHTVSFMEPNRAILVLEILLCALAISWGINRWFRRGHGES